MGEFPYRNKEGISPGEDQRESGGRPPDVPPSVSLEEAIAREMPPRAQEYLKGSQRENGLFFSFLERHPRFQKYAQVLTLFTQLAGPAQVFHQPKPEAVPVKAEVEYVESIERGLSAEDRKVFEYLGLDIEKFDADYDVSVPVNRGPEGKYIMHIGQFHASTEAGFYDVLTKNTVIENQKALGKLLQYLIKEKGVAGVFDEGVADIGAIESIKAYLKEIEARLREIGASPVRVTDLEKFMSLRDKATKQLGQNRLGQLYLSYFSGKKAREIDAAIERGDSELDTEMGRSMQEVYQADRLLSALSGLTSVVADSEEMLHHGGAQFKMYYEDLLQHILPTEDPDVNRKAIEIFLAQSKKQEEVWTLKTEIGTRTIRHPDVRKGLDEIERRRAAGASDSELESLRRDINEAWDRVENELRQNEEFQSLGQLKDQADQLQREYDYWVRTRREDVAIELIRLHGEKVGDTKFYPLVYGDAHDWTDNIQKHNELNTDDTRDYGLIRLTPRKK